MSIMYLLISFGAGYYRSGSLSDTGYFPIYGNRAGVASFKISVDGKPVKSGGPAGEVILDLGGKVKKTLRRNCLQNRLDDPQLRHVLNREAKRSIEEGYKGKTAITVRVV